MSVDGEPILGYYRVSTRNQESDGNALERYKFSLQRFGVAEADLYFDVDSGGKVNREGLNRLISRVRIDSSVSGIAVPSHDRLHRDVVFWLETLKPLIEEFRLDFYDLKKSRTAPIDLASADGEYNSTIDAAFAQKTRRIIQEHALEGHAFRRSQGKSTNRCFGYTAAGTGIIRPDLSPYYETGYTRFGAARLLADLYFEHGSFAAAVRNIPSEWSAYTKQFDHPRSSAGYRKWIRNPILQGTRSHFVWLREADRRPHQSPILELNNHEALLTPDEISQISDAAKAPAKAKGSPHRLTGLCVCSECGKTLKRETSPKWSKAGEPKRYYEFLKCRGAYPSPEKPQVCDRRMPVAYSKIESQIQAKLIQRSEQIAREAAKPMETAESTEVIELRAAIQKLKGLNDPDLLSAIKAKEDKIATILSARGDLSAKNPQVATLQALIATPGFWDADDDPNELGTIYRGLISSCIVDVALAEVISISFL